MLRHPAGRAGATAPHGHVPDVERNRTRPNIDTERRTSAQARTRMSASTACGTWRPHRTALPNDSTESRADSLPRPPITAYLWSVEPSTVVFERGARLVRAAGPEWGRVEVDVDPLVDVGRREPGWSRPAVVFSASVDGHGRLASGPRADEVAAARVSGAWAYLRHAAAAGDMKPCGHDRRELTHVGDRTGGGSCRFCELPGGRGPISCGVGEAADLAVAQAVVDESQQVAGGGDAADVATTAGADAGFHRGDLRITRSSGDGLDGGPAQQA